MIKTIAIFLASASTLQAACDNLCSGHGTCLADDVCSCYDNWGVGLSMESGDCSDRICPFDIAWVDTPNAIGEFHKYAECSGRGICDRSSGLCECFDGYEGKACQRTTCPNDCSGHGTCEYIEDIPFGVVWNQYMNGYDFRSYPKQLNYYEWDKTKTRGCVCDAQYADVDCSKRMCPHGNDVLDLKDNNLLGSDNHQIQRLIFMEDEDLNEAVSSRRLQGQPGTNRDSQTFALTFKTRINETFTTYPIRFDVANGNAANLVDLRDDIHLALLSLPNQVIDACVVTVEYDWPQTTVDITFTGDAVQGRQNLLMVEDFECSDGCTPKITGLVLETTAAESLQSRVYEFQESHLNSYECGRRGKCDYSTGLCQCFEGYTGENCNEQTTLV
eukprot:CAMPEP_0185024788 /NCGR_PEP_ID=MMETSP1103-20130426/7999_1 /TAXON_ID=36769 /ORGANISM="Paraphysomonas bandaiensis, Strain Caron Lab Isolate" /LENGTH=386 /DNA_ID=CAMNT_0027557853 /DNA_START=30 /DNA_END=1190 /DNA_ORIENTATION=+